MARLKFVLLLCVKSLGLGLKYEGFVMVVVQSTMGDNGGGVGGGVVE